jgi:hypothetical protein
MAQAYPEPCEAYVLTGDKDSLQLIDATSFVLLAGNTETKRISHVGIYLGDGKIIHASHKVRINSLIPGEKDYYENSHRLLKARRYIGWQGPGMLPTIQSPAYFLW